ncbi:MAG: SOS response-associated peptidase, partial [Gemmatimonadota bacterium]|nr:SOS response-associated peptidase [Gemmatimonadota bacterium]
AKTPHLLRRRDGASFAMAGLWSAWRGDGSAEDELYSCSVVIGASDEWYAQFHSRMAYLLPPSAYDAWLDPELTDPAEVAKVLAGAPFPHDAELESIVVSRRVNNPRYDAPDCLVADAA